MSAVKNFIFNKYWLWLLLSLPGLVMLGGLINGGVAYEMLMHATGEFSARFLIIALIATPIALLFPKGRVSRWLVRNRRYFGLASFAYALLHTALYVEEVPFMQVMRESLQVGMLAGWIAFFIFIPLAITSNDASVKRMGTTWKKLQRWVYLAAILTFAHWCFVHYHWKPALVHFAPVMLLQVYRIWKQKQLNNQKVATN